MTSSVGNPRRSVVTDRWFLLVCLATFGFWVSVFSHLPLVPLYLQHIGTGVTTIGLVFGIGALGALFGRIAFGWAVDRYGERWFFLVGAGLWLVTALWTPATREPSWVAASWVIKGVGLGVFTTAAASWIGRYAPADQRGLAMGWWGATNPIAAVTAPTVFVFFQQRWGFTTAFALTMVSAAIACLAAFAPDTVAAGAAAQLPVRRIELFVEPSALEPGAVGFLVAIATNAFAVFVPVLAAAAGKVNPGLYLSVYAAASILARFVAGPASDRWGRPAAIGPSLTTAAVGISLLVASDNTAVGLLAAGLFGLGLGGAMPALMAWTTDRALPRRRGVAAGTYFSMYEVGMFSGAAAMGPALDRFGLLAFLGVGVMLGAVTAVYLARHWSRRPAGRPADGVPTALVAEEGG